MTGDTTGKLLRTTTTLATIGSASQCKNNQRQIDILDYSKTLAESGLKLMMAAKEGGGNPKVRNLLI